MSKICLFIAAMAGSLGVLALSAPPKDAPQSGSLDPLVELLLEISEPAVQLDVLKGMQAAIKGQRNLPRPAKWSRTARKLAKSPNAEVRELALSLSLTFGDPDAMKTLRAVVQNKNAPLKERRSAMAALAQVRDEKLLPILHSLLEESELRETVLKSLSAYDSPQTPALILEHYAKFHPAERKSALHTLVSRPAYAEALLSAVEQKQVPAQDLSTYLVRQIAAFENEKLNAKLRRVWGEFRPTSEEKAQQIAALKSKLTDEFFEKADQSQGRAVFVKTCAGCHVLFDAGRHVGPNLTGSQRNNLDYVLENVFDPSAVVGRDYRLTTLATADGRLLTGIVTEESAESLTLKTPEDDVLIAKSEIEARKQSPISMMPEGLFEKLSEEEIRDLIAYLDSPKQVPLPADARK